MTRRFESLTQTVYLRLRSQILTGQLMPGHKLNISSLCTALDGSLPAIRESLSRLTAENLVVAEPFKGFRVAPISISELMQLTEARIEIERLCLTISINNGGIEWEGRVVSLLHQLSRFPGKNSVTDVMNDWSKVHAQFHSALTSACDNVWLLDIRQRLYEQGERYRLLPFALDANPRERDTLLEHKLLAQAALDRNVTKIVKLMSEHLQRTSALLIERLSVDTDRPDQAPLRLKHRNTPVA